MKKIYNILAAVTVIVIIIFACTKDADIQFSFPFELTKNHDEIATINYKEPTLIRINPERIVTDNVYEFSYRIVTGSGYFRYNAQQEIVSDTWNICEDLELNLEFIGTELGKVSIEFTVKDIDERTEVINLTYEVIHNPFKWEANASLSNVVINQETPLSLLLENTGENQSVTYQYKVYFKQGNGEIYFTDESGNSTTELELNTLEDITPDIHYYNVKFNQTGLNEIVFEALDSNGQIKTTSLIFTVDVIDFTFIGSPESNTMYIGEEININFDVSEILGGGDSYEARFEFINGSANISRVRNQVTENLDAGVFYPISVGSYYWTFSANLHGPIEMTFYVKNASGVEHSVNITIIVNRGSFEFSAISTESISTVNDQVIVNFDINQVGLSGLPYQLTFTSSLNGTFTYNNEVYLPGQVITVNELNFSGAYTGLINGQHQIHFTATNNYEDSITDIVNIVFNQDLFNLVIASEKSSLFVDETTSFNFNISDSDNGSTYQMYYIITGDGSATLSSGGSNFEPGTLYNVTNGAFSWQIKALTAGSLTYTFFVENNSSNQQSQSVEINVLENPPSDFTFSAIASDNSAVVGGGVPVNFNLTQTVGTSSYSMVFTSSATGTFNYNGVNYNQGQPITVTAGNFTGTYTGSNSGVHDVEFTVTNANSTPVSRSDNVSITYSNIDFNLTSSGDGSLFVNTAKSLNVFLSQSLTDPSITYQVVFTLTTGTVGDGTLTRSGTPITYGTAYPISLGSSTYTFNASSVGLVNILATVTDSNGQVHDTTVAMNVQNIDFAFSGAAQQNNIAIGEVTSLNFNISEEFASGANYQMKYVIVNGNGNIIDGGNTQSVNAWYNVNIGAYSWDFESVASGDVELLFTVRNQTSLVEHTQTIDISVSAAPPSDFTFSAIASGNSAVVGGGVPVNFNLTQTVGTSSYSMVFTSSATGTFNYNGVNYNQGQPITVTAGNFTGTYTGSDSGVHDVEFTVTNANSTPVSKSDNVSITYSNIDFNLTSSGDGSLFVNTDKDFNVFLSQSLTDPSITYQVVFTLTTGTVGDGTLTRSGTPITYGTAYPISLGSSTYTFSASSVGLVNILATVTDSNGQVHDTTVAMNVQNIDFAFSGAAQQTTIGINEFTNLNFDITESASSGSQYQMKYVIVSGSGNLSNGGTSLNANVWYNVNIGSYSWDFESVASGDVELLFTARNQTTLVEHTQSIDISVSAAPPSDFTFSAIASGNSAVVGGGVPVNFNLTQTVGTSSYSMVFTSSATGTFNYNGVNYNQGQPITVTAGNFTGTYTGSDSGVHDVEFTVTNANSTPVSKSDNVSITYSNIDFNLTSSGDGSLFVNTDKDFNVFLSQSLTDPSITYQVVFTLTTGTVGDGALTRSGTPITYGTAYPISLGSSTYTFNASSVGLVNILATVTDSNGQVHDTTVAMNVQNIDFAFSGAAQQTTIGINEFTNLNFDITESASSGSQYQMKYVIVNGSGNLSNGGTSLNANVWYNVNIGSYSWDFESVASGDVELLFTARNQTTLVEHTQSIDISVSAAPPSDFTFSAIASGNSAVVGGGVPVNFNLTQTVGTSSYSMVFTSSATGTFNYNGVNYNQGQPITVTAGNFTGTYTGSDSGVHDVEFTVTNANSTPVSRSDNVSITYSNIDFNLTSSGDGSLFVNTDKDFNVFLSQSLTDPSITYQVVFTLTTGTVGDGALTRSGTPITYGTAYPISLGSSTYTFSASSVGLVNILATVTDSNGQVHDTTVAMNVQNIDFAFSGAAQQTTIGINEFTNLNFDITESASSGSQYQMKYVIVSGSGNLSNGGTSLNANVWYNVNIGAYSWDFESVASGDVELLFTARNQTTLVEHTQSIDISVSAAPPSDFTFSAIASGNSAVVGGGVPVNFNLTQTVGTSSYSMVFTSSATGTFNYNGVNYNQGQPITVTAGNFTGTYTGSDSGVHDVEFTVTNANSTPVSRSDNVSITYSNIDFNLTSSGDGSLFVNTDKDFNVFLSQSLTDPSITYQVVFTLTTGTVGDGTLTRSGTPITYGTAYPISLGSSTYTFSASSVGLVNILATVTDSNGQVHDTTVAMNVQNIDFAFSGAAQQTTIGINEFTNLNFDITESASSGSQYQMKYVIVSGSGNLSNGGTSLNANVWYNVNIGSYSWDFESVASGDVELLFTARNQTTLVEHTQSIDITVSAAPPSDFTFSAIASGNSAVVGGGVPVNFNLTQTVGTSSYSMVFTSSATGTFNYNGVNYNQGQPITVTPGNFTGTYTGSDSGVHDVEFTVTNANSTPVSRSDNVSITYSNIDFNLTSSGDGSLFVNTDKDFNVFLSQSLTDPSITYQVVFTLTTGTVGDGALTRSGTPITYGTAYPISLGSSTYTFSASSVGLVNILATVTDSNGQVHDTTVAMNVQNIDFAFSGAAQQTTIGINEFTNLNFDITESASSGSQYQMKYVIIGGSGNLSNGGTALNANVWYNVNIGSYSWDFESVASGDVELLFTARNQTTLVEHTQSIDITVSAAPPSDFTFSAIASGNSAVVGGGVPVNFNLTQTVGTSSYSMVFTSSATGTFNYNGVNYNQGQPITVTAGNFTGTYTGSDSGVHDVEFTVTNANSTPVSRSDNVSITYSNIDFNLTSSGDGSLFVNTDKDFNVFLSQSLTDPSITYQVVFTLTTGTVGDGALTRSGTPITYGTAYPISLGSSTYTFSASSVGLVNILATVTDSNGQVHDTTVAMNVQNIDFAFSGAAQQTTIGINEFTNLNFDITESASSGSQYQMKYVIVGGSGNLSNGGTSLNANVWYNVNIGAYSWDFESVASGDVELLFTARNQTTLVEHTQTIDITVSAAPPSDFTFSAIASGNSAVVGGGVPVNFNLTETVGNSTYTMVFTSSATGTFNYNGVNYNQGQPITVTAGNFTGTYTGSDSGVHDVEFTVTNANSTPVSRSDNVSITYSNIDFNLTSSGDGSLFVNTDKDFNVFLSQSLTDPSITYQVVFTLTTGTVGDGALTRSGTPITYGTAYPISLGSSTYTFSASSVGLVNILATVTDSNGQVHDTTVAMNVQNIDFAFSGAAQQTTIGINEFTNLNFDITESASSGSQYQMKYVIVGGSGNLSNGGTSLNANVWYNVNIGAYSWDFESVASGDVELLFTARNQTTLVEHTQTIDITVSAAPPSDFTFSAIASGNSAVVGGGVPVNFNLTETVGNSTYTMVFTSSATGTFNYNGVNYNQGQPITVTAGNFTGTYTGSDSGVHDVEFTVTNANSTPVSKSDNVSITYSNIDFNLTSSGDGSLFVNTDKDFNVFLSQSLTDPSITYQVVFTLTTGTVGDGALTRSGTPITYGTAYPISLGNSTYTFSASSVGLVNILATVTDSNGQVHDTTVAMNVQNIDFAFSGAAQQNVISIGERTSLNFNISEEFASGASYQMKYVIINGNGNIIDGGNTQSVNAWYNVNIGSYSWDFESVASGDVELLFTARNQTTLVEHTQSIDISVSAAPPSDFTFSAIASGNSAVVGGGVPVNFNLTETVGNSTYTMVFTSSATGTFNYNGVNYNQGQPITVTAGNFTGTYTGSNSGVHDVEFTVTNANSTPVSRSDNVSITYSNIDFNLTSSGDGSLFVNTDKDFNVFLSQSLTDPSITYQVVFTLTTGTVGDGALTRSGTPITYGTAYPISLGSSTYTFSASSVGLVNILATVTDSNGQVHDTTVAMNVQNIDFAFSGAAQQTTIGINEFTNLNFDITESASSGSQYQMKYVIVSGSGNLSNGGTALNANVWYNVNIGSYSWDFESVASGDVELLFTARNQTTLVEHTQTIDITVSAAPPSDFTFSAIASSNSAVVGGGVPVNFNLTQTVGTSSYSMVFTSSATGTFNYNGVNYNQGQPITVTPGNFTGTYTGSDSGVHDVEFTVTNANSTPVSKSDNVSITYSNIDFNLTSSGDGSLFVNTDKDFNVFLSQSLTDPSITYQVVFTLTTGTVGDGALTRSGTPITYGTAYPISLGSSTYTFSASSVGLVNILATVTDSNGQVHDTTVAMNVQNIDFAFSGAAQQTTIGINEFTNLNFDITESASSGSQYQMKYVIVSGSGNLSNGGTSLNANVWYNVNIGSYSWDFESVASGDVELLFTARNQTTLVEHTQSIDISVSAAPPSDFTFSAIASSNSAVVGNSVPVNFNLTETVGNSTYTMVFTSSATGTFNYNGVNYNQGQPITVTAGNFTGTYTGSDSGVHDVEFTVTNANSTPVSKSDNVSITYSNIDFNLTSSGDGSLFVNTDKDFNVFLSQSLTDPSITYQVVFTLTTGTVGDGALTRSGTPITYGTAYPISLGSSTYTFNASSVGLVNILATVTDSNGQVHDTTVAMNVQNIDFAFSGAAQQTTIGINEFTNLNFDITESASSGSQYQMKYVIVSGSGNILNGGSTQSANTWYNVNIGAYSWDFESVASGDVELLFTARNQTTLVEHTQSIDISVSAAPPSDFTFSAIASSNSAVVGNSVPVNFNLTETVGNSTYTMVFTSSATGTFNYNGVNYNQGQPITVTAGNFTGTYTGSDSGVHDVEFTVTNANSTPVSRSDNVSITYSNIDFNLTSSGDGSLFVNTDKDFNVFLSQSLTDPSITYQVVFTLTTGTVGDGALTRSGTPITYGTAYPISLGSSTYTFSASSVGLVNILATVTDSNGQVHDTTVAMNVQNIDFAFSGAAQQTTIGINEFTNLNFDITESASSGSQYQMKYVIVSGSGNILNGGSTQSANTWYNVNIGAYSWDFESVASGDVELLFTARNQTTLVEHTQSIDISVSAAPPSDFTFSAIASSNSAVVGNSVPVNFNLTETVGNSTYTMVFTSSATGTFNYNGVNYNQGQPITVTAGNFTGTYTGSDSGVHDVEFTVTNANSTPVSRSDNVSITYSNIDFNLSTVGDGSLLLNTQKDIFVIISQAITDPSITYQVRFSIQGGSTGNGEVYNNSGTLINQGIYQNINVGSTGFTFKGTTAGGVDLLVEVLDSNGTIRNSTITFEIDNFNFTFSATPQDGTILLGESTSIFFNITENTASNTNYEIQYEITSSVTGELLAGGSIVNPLSYIPISVGSSNWLFNSTEEGNVNINFTVNNIDTGVTASDNITVSVDLPDTNYNFNATSTVTNSALNTPVTINFNIINNTGASATYTMRYTSDVTGVFNYNGANYSPGQLIPVPEGSFSGTYTSSTEGDSNLEFIVQSSNSIIKTDNVDITFGAPFEISISSAASIPLGSNTNIDVSVNVLIPNSGPYSAFYNFTSAIDNANINYSGSNLNEGTNVSVNSGSNIFNFTPLETGTFDIEFTITNPSYTLTSNISISVTLSPPTLNAVNTLLYDNYNTIVTSSGGNASGGWSNSNIYMNLILQDIDYTSAAAIDKIEINGNLYDVIDITNIAINAGHMTSNYTYSQVGVSTRFEDYTVTLKRGMSLTIRIRDINGQYSNPININLPTLYNVVTGTSLPVGGVYFNGVYAGTTYTP